MTSMRVLKNAINAKQMQGIISCVPKHWNKEQMFCFKRAVPLGFIRNTRTTKTTVGQNTVSCNTFYDDKKWNQQGGSMLFTNRSLNTFGLVPQYFSHCNLRKISIHSGPDRAIKSDTKSAAVTGADLDIFAESSKLGLFDRFKLMYKMYWYVLIPVHIVTSAGWLVGFYYLSQSGVDVPALLQYMHLSETIIEKVQGSSLGHWAVAYLCYKVATPVRYAVTLGGTTVSIKHLVQQGYIKPLPTKAQILKMYEDKKAQRAAERSIIETEGKHTPEQK